MPITTTGSLVESVVTLFDPAYRMAVRHKAVWDQFMTPYPQTNGKRGVTVQIPLYDLLDPATATLSQTADVTPVVPVDSSVQVTLSDYGNAVTYGQYLEATAHTQIERVVRDVVAQNSVDSQEILARDVSVAGTQVLRGPNRLAARTGLDATNDLVTYAYLVELKLRAQGTALDRFGSMVSVVRPELLADIAGLTLWQNVGSYQEASVIYNAEVGTLAGIRFMASNYGKVFLSGGTTAQAATTISASVAAGATTMAVADATGIAAGDYVVVDTLEATNSEQVLVTTVTGTDATISGAGNDVGNTGFAYSHASAAAVTESANAYAIPVLGKDAVFHLFSDITGREGKLMVTGPFDSLGRFRNFGWHAISGWGRGIERYLVRGEVAGSIKPITTFYGIKGLVGS